MNILHRLLDVDKETLHFPTRFFHTYTTRNSFFVHISHSIGFPASIHNNFQRR